MNKHGLPECSDKVKRLFTGRELLCGRLSECHYNEVSSLLDSKIPICVLSIKISSNIVLDKQLVDKLKACIVRKC